MQLQIVLHRELEQAGKRRETLVNGGYVNQDVIHSPKHERTEIFRQQCNQRVLQLHNGLGPPVKYACKRINDIRGNKLLTFLRAPREREQLVATRKVEDSEVL